MKKISLSLLMLLVAAVGAQAKYWKIGPSSVTGMDFASINAAMSSTEVAAGDTLYLDQNYNESATQTVTKRVVIIGTGYDTSFTDEGVVARLTGTLNLKANGAVVKSVKLTTVQFYNDDCILDRCYATSVSTQSSTAGMNHVYSCYVNGYIYGYSNTSYSQYDIQNCVILSSLYYMQSSIINNNTIITNYSSTSSNTLYAIKNTVITNNIILNIYSGSAYYNIELKSDVYASGSGNTIEHNVLSHTGALSYYPTNKTGYGGSSSELFTQTGNYSNYYKLADKSVAKDYATDGGEVGAHGGMFGCPSGGRPQYIPYFTKVTVGSRSENGKLPVSVTVKIQDE
ncbi:MAG: hypothetical protein IJ762_10275 [Bacteroidaceae bacterium]|nr:hypothetical protein [Bacteroidaceae bacterium]